VSLPRRINGYEMDIRFPNIRLRNKTEEKCADLPVLLADEARIIEILAKDMVDRLALMKIRPRVPGNSYAMYEVHILSIPDQHHGSCQEGCLKTACLYRYNKGFSAEKFQTSSKLEPPQSLKALIQRQMPFENLPLP
jgi:hypothetical protein